MADEQFRQEQVAFHEPAVPGGARLLTPDQWEIPSLQTLSNVVVPRSEILSGGPPRDGIPSIDQPAFVPPARARFLRANDLVVSVNLGGAVRAYPFRILERHEIVNDPETASGRKVPSVSVYWFAWQAFYPDTEL